MMITLAILALAAGDEPLSLTCRGAGAANKTDTTSAYGGNSNGESGWATVEGHHREQFENQVDVRISDSDSRIRLPRIMLPSIHDGDGGWFKLKNVVVGEDVITASVAVNPINNPKVHVDRRTGLISIDGRAGHYTGECERFDPATQPKRF